MTCGFTGTSHGMTPRQLKAVRQLLGHVDAPKDFVEPASKRGQGTWTTIGYARQAKRRIWIVLPDGRVKVE
jgi:hypothetical protein